MLKLEDVSMLKPSRLNKGDTVALLSPSSSLAGIFPHRIDNAIKALHNLGFEIKEFPTTRKVTGYSAGTPEKRAKDINDAFSDKSVKAIICTIGGMTANQVLEHIDFSTVRDNPTIFCGYSDISVLHYAFHTKANLVTFYGPAAITQFGEHPKPLDYTVKYFLKAVASSEPVGNVKPAKEWTEEFLDWSAKTDMARPRNMVQNQGFEWLSEGDAQGGSIGGCISSILHLKGTEYWPDYSNKILFLETPEGQDPGKGLPLPYVDSYLTYLELMGVFNEISGLIFGRPYMYTESEKTKLKEILSDIGKKYSFPILFGADIGHTDPMITLPLGVKVSISSETGIFSINESGVI